MRWVGGSLSAAQVEHAIELIGPWAATIAQLSAVVALAAIALCLAALLALAETVVDGLSRYSLLGVMSGERYFRGGGLPWPGLFVSAAASALMLYGAALNLARRDF